MRATQHATSDLARRGRPVRVLVVDDSALVRLVLSEILNSDPDIEVVGCASDPYAAAAVLRKVEVDVMTLDIEMPRMDGLTFLQKLMRQHPMPVVICSSLARPDAESTLRALELGAVEIIAKPQVGTKKFLEDGRIRIRDCIRAAAKVRFGGPRSPKAGVQKKLTADVILPAGVRAMSETTENIVVVGASTGGTEALRQVLGALPENSPGIVVVQHMPERFTHAFAKRLDTLCRVRVQEASNGDSILRGHVLVAPGNRHTLIKRSGARYFVEVRDGPLVCRHRPAVDVLFRSAARYAGRNAVGVLLTGMGDDGARGLAEMKAAGAWTVAQDEASCIVFGMPKEAIKRDAVCSVVPLGRMAAEVLKKCLHRP